MSLYDPEDDPVEHDYPLTYDRGGRFITREDVLQLGEEIVDTDNTIRGGLSLIGIDPSNFDTTDIVFISKQLMKTGVRFCKHQRIWVEVKR